MAQNNEITSQQKTILLVEDEVLSAMITSKVVQSFGYAVIIANAGEDAVKNAISDENIHLVLMDINLGEGMDGTQAAQQILEKRNLPIVFLSSHAEKAYVDRVKRITHYGYVVKNSGNFVLKSSIEMAFELFESNKKLLQREERYRLITENMRDTVWLMDMNFQTTWVSPSVVTTRGYTLEEIQQLPVDKNMTASSWAASQKLMAEVLTPQRLADKNDHISGQEEFEYIRKDGVRIWADTIITLLRDENGLPCGFLGVGRDVTERKLVEAELRRKEQEFKAINEKLKENEQKFSGVIEQMTEGVSITDANGLVVEWNRAMETLTGLNKSAVLGQPVWEIQSKLVPEVIKDQIPNLAEQIQAEVLRILRVCDHDTAKKESDWVSRSMEQQIQRPDGSSRWVEDTTFIVRNETSQYLGTLLRDITEQRMVVTLLQESQQRLIESHRLARMGLWNWEMATDTVTWSEELYRIAGLDPTIPAPTYADHYKLYSPKSLKLLQAAVANALQTGSPYQLELELIHADGNTRWVNAFGGASYDTFGKIIGLFGMVQDITDHKQAEEKIRNLLKEKEILLKEVHHRIKNNMSTIRCLLMLQADTLKDPSAIAALNDAENRVISMMVLYDKLYLSSNYKEVPAKGYLPTLIDEILDNFPNRACVTVEKKIDAFLLGAKTLSSLGMIINELLTNAMKYAFRDAQHGLLTISASKKDTCVSICIEDDGAGIPESVTIENSTGFGLQLVDMLVKQMKGTIKIERGNGTKITLQFEA